MRRLTRNAWRRRPSDLRTAQVPGVWPVPCTARRPSIEGPRHRPRRSAGAHGHGQVRSAEAGRADRRRVGHITAGHTPGCTSWAFPVHHADRDLLAVDVCSLTLLPFMKLSSRSRIRGSARTSSAAFKHSGACPRTSSWARTAALSTCTESVASARTRGIRPRRSSIGRATSATSTTPRSGSGANSPISRRDPL